MCMHVLLHTVYIRNIFFKMTCNNDVIIRMNRAILGIAPITEGMATVTISDLQCEVTYNITAEGMLDGRPVGSRSSHNSVTPGPCPMTFSEYKAIMYMYITHITHYVKTIVQNQ